MLRISLSVLSLAGLSSLTQEHLTRLERPVRNKHSTLLLTFVNYGHNILYSTWAYGQVSISPIFYEYLFHTNVFCAAFMCLQFGFVIFWQKDFGTKAAHKMNMTPGACVIKLFTVVIYLDSTVKP